MAYNNIATLEEAKAYFKSLWQPMEPKCVLSNLQRILNFLQSPAEEMCFVNMQEKYLPFYYMLILDEEFLQTTFLTDECKMVANKILKTLEVNKNSFTWEVSFSTQIAGIPVIFKKVYTSPYQVHPAERYERPIRLAFMETWINATLKFIKSSRLILKYPEMPRREAQYLYKGILKLNEEEIGSDSLWAPVWEALNIFKLRYKYIVSIYPTSSDYLKYVHFEKVTHRRKSCAVEIENSIAPFAIKEPNLLTDCINDDGKNKAMAIHEKVTDLLTPVINHNELVKTLLEMNVTNAGTLVYTLKIEGANSATKPITNELQNEVIQSSDENNVTDISALNENEAAYSETTIQSANLALSDSGLANVNLTVVVQSEVSKVDVQHPDLNSTPENENELEFSKEAVTAYHTSNQKDTIICNKDVNTPDHDGNENEIVEVVDTRENIVTNLLSDIENIRRVENFKQAAENDVNCDSIKTEEIESNNDEKIALLEEINTDVDNNLPTINKNSDTEINVTHDTENPSSTHEMDSQNLNPSPKQQKQNQPLFLKEEDFIPTDDANEHDIVPKKKLESIKLNASSDIYRYSLVKLIKPKGAKKNPPSAKQIRKRELRTQRRFENTVRKKRILIETVPSRFIVTSFNAILDFIDDESRATMEMGSLNIHEFNVLRKLYGFSPEVVPIEEIFNYSCLDVAIQLYQRLREINEYLEISWIKPHKMEKQASTDCTRQRCLLLTKRPFKKPRNMNPKSILEKMRLVPPIKTRSSSRGSGVSRGHNRSASVSPARPSVSPAGHKLEQSKSKSMDVAEDTDRSVRTPTTSTGKLAVTMKANMLERLAVPLESDKAMRMMRLMGWNGGALGVRGEGIIEPIQPQLDVPRGVGLGHKMFKKTKLKTTKLQKKLHKKHMVEKKAEAAKVNYNSGYISEINEDNHIIILDNNNEKNTVVDKPESFTRHMKSVNKSLHTVINVVENQYNSNEITPNSSDFDATKPIDKEKQGSTWLTNESLIQKLKNRSNSNEGTQCKGTSLSMKDVDENRQENNDDDDRWVVAGDDKLLPYTLEPEYKQLSARMQFMVHLLDLLQSERKSVTTVCYSRKLSQDCVIFIEKTIWSLNQRVELVAPPFPRAVTIAKACAKEMEAHGYLLSYRFEKKLLTLVKTNDSSKVNELYALACTADNQLGITHNLNDLHVYGPRPNARLSDTVREKINSNRAILEFVRSGDEERVYYYGRRTSGEIRNYIAFLISLLNRQMSRYQLGVGVSEHPILKETLHRTRNICILYRFDQYNSKFTKLQLVRVDLERRCRFCQITNKATNLLEETVNTDDIDEIVDNDDIDDIDLYPNMFDDKKDETDNKSDNDLITDKVTDSLKLNTEDIFHDTDYIEWDEQYLIGEDWQVGDDNNKTTSNRSDTTPNLNTDENNSNNLQKLPPKVDSDIESSNVNNALKNSKENISRQQMSSDFHNWPKRIKRHEKDNNYHDENMKWMANRYESNFQDFPKRKVTNKNAGKKAVEDITLNTTNDVVIDLCDTDTDEDIKDNIEFEEECTIIVDIDEEKVDADRVKSDVIEERDANIAEDREGSHKDVGTATKDLNLTTLPNNNWPKNILIVHYDPKHEIDTIGVKCLQSIIYEAVKKYSFLPRLKCYGVKNGGVLYKCYDFDSYIWLFDHLQWYKISEYKDEIQTKHKIQMKINTYIKIDVKGIFKNIERYYESIKTEAWKVLKTVDYADYCLINIEIDDFSLDNIKKEGYSLFVGVDTADVSVIYDH